MNRRRPGAGRRTRRSAGFTLIELIVAMLIIVVLVAGLAIGLGSLRRADLTAITGRIDGTVRYLYQLATIHATPFRLVVDIDQGQWQVEVLEQETGPCRSFSVKDVRKKDLPSGDAKKGRKGRFGDKKKEESEMSRCGEEERDADGNCPIGGFAEVPERLLQPRKLPMGVKFTGVMTTHQQDVQTEGKAYVYFFPNGTAEKAYIYVSTESETFTIETFALLGKVKVHHKKLDLGGVLREEQ